MVWGWDDVCPSHIPWGQVFSWAQQEDLPSFCGSRNKAQRNLSCYFSEHRPVPAPDFLCSAALWEATGWDRGLVGLKYGSAAAAVFPLCPQIKGQLLESQMLSHGSLLVVMGTVLWKGKGVISLGRCLENY